MRKEREEESPGRRSARGEEIEVAGEGDSAGGADHGVARARAE